MVNIKSGLSPANLPTRARWFRLGGMWPEGATKRAFKSQGKSSRGAPQEEIVVSAFIVRPGDLVVCVDDRLPNGPCPLHQQVKDRVRAGEYYRVTAIIWLYGEKGLHLEGKDHAPTDGWRACRFRKIDADNVDGGVRVKTTLADIELNGRPRF